MSTATTSFWSKLFRRRPQTNSPRPIVPGISDELAAGSSSDISESTNEVADRASGPLARWNRRDQAIVQLQEGYEKITRVIEDVQQHLVQQGERSERLCNAIEQIARTMAEGPQLARQQAKTLENIATQLETANTRTQHLADTLGELPRVTKTQTDALTGIKEHLQVSNEQRVVTSQTMDRLGTSLQSLGETSEAQGEILKQMNQQTAEQSKQLTQLIAQQSQRFQLLFIVTIVMAAAAIGVAVIGLTMFRN